MRRTPEFLLGIVVLTAACTQSSRQSADWRTDLRTLADELPKVHRNPYHSISRDEWQTAVTRLNERIPHLKRHEVIVEISKLVAMIGDGHTCFQSFYDPPISFRRYPVTYYSFSDGLYVRGADPRYRDAVGGRVLKIGHATAEEAMKAAAKVDGADNPMWSLLTAPWRLETAEVVAALGLTDDIEHTPLLVEKDGKQIEVVLTPEEVPEAQRDSSALPAGWIDASADPKMFWQRDRDNKFWYEYMPAHRALYVQFNRVLDKDDETLEGFFDGVFAFVTSHDVDRLVLDMRHNGGGNNYLVPPIVKGIMRSPKLNQRGKVFVLIGRHTFSAAQNTVDWLKKWTDAIFVGEPTGSSPNQYADAVPVPLPKSGLAPQVSTVLWQDIDERSKDRWLAPDLAVEMRGEDYRRGVDPILDVALAAQPEPSLGERLREAVASGGGDAAVRRIAGEYLANPLHKYASFEFDLNNLGYELMASKKLGEAVAVLEVNTQAFPESANAWDSYAEALMNRGNKAGAIAGYRRSLALNPGNANATAMLRKLKAPGYGDPRGDTPTPSPG